MTEPCPAALPYGCFPYTEWLPVLLLYVPNFKKGMLWYEEVYMPY